MKLIAMMPVRNESLLLPHSLRCLCEFCDHVIVADQHSTDDTVEIARRFAKVEVIDYDGTVSTAPARRVTRAMLLDRFRAHEGQNLGLCLDADEIAPPTAFRRLKDAVAHVGRPGAVFSFAWIHLWKGLDRYLTDGIFANTWKPMAFWDDRKATFPSEQHLIHEYRFPTERERSIRMEDFPVFHLQFALWEASQWKQAWYRVLEFKDAGFRHAREINLKYACTLDQPAITATMPAGWMPEIENIRDGETWHSREIEAVLEQDGIERFEPLQIWHISKLRELFQSRTGSAPRSLVYRAPALWARQAAGIILPPRVRGRIKAILSR